MACVPPVYYGARPRGPAPAPTLAPAPAPGYGLTGAANFPLPSLPRQEAVAERPIKTEDDEGLNKRQRLSSPGKDKTMDTDENVLETDNSELYIEMDEEYHAMMGVKRLMDEPMMTDEELSSELKAHWG